MREKKNGTQQAIRLVLVDDSASFMAAATQFLATAPTLQVIGTAYSGPDGLEQVSTLQPDLVLLDLALPGLNGFEITRQLRRLANEPYIIILTLHDSPEYRARATQLGANGFVAKSEFGTQLLPLIYELFELASPEGQRISPDQSGWID